MKPGDLIIKTSGMDLNKKGLVLRVVCAAGSHKVVSTLVEGKIRNWSMHLVEVINEVGS